MRGKGNRLTKTLENGITSTYNYDDAERLTSLVHGTSVETLSYTYDAMSRRTSEPSCEGSSAVDPADAGPARVTMSAGSGGHQTRTSGGLRTFGYDATGQLLQVTHSGGSATFNYDAVGTPGAWESSGEIPRRRDPTGEMSGSERVKSSPRSPPAERPTRSKTPSAAQ